MRDAEFILPEKMQNRSLPSSLRSVYPPSLSVHRLPLPPLCEVTFLISFFLSFSFWLVGGRCGRGANLFSDILKMKRNEKCYKHEMYFPWFLFRFKLTEEKKSTEEFSFRGKKSIDFLYQ